MPKDSQIDKKSARKQKNPDGTPLTKENQNHTRNAKKQSIKKGEYK